MKNKNIIRFTLIGISILIALISGCVESDKQEFKPAAEEANATANATGESKIGGINESENIPYESNFTNQTTETDLNITENITEKEPELETEYLFVWDDVPGKDSPQFIKFLKEDLNIYWADNAGIKKSDDNKIITASYGRNSVNLELKEKENKITIETVKVTEREDYDCVFKIEKGKINIYSISIPEPKLEQEPQIKRIKFNIRGLTTSAEAHQIDSKLGGLAGVIYAHVDVIDKNGEVLFDTAEITTDEILKEGGFIKTAGGLIVMDLTLTLTEEIDCKKSGEFYCCGREDCKLYP